MAAVREGDTRKGGGNEAKETEIRKISFNPVTLGDLRASLNSSGKLAFRLVSLIDDTAFIERRAAMHTDYSSY